LNQRKSFGNHVSQTNPKTQTNTNKHKHRVKSFLPSSGLPSMPKVDENVGKFK